MNRTVATVLLTLLVVLALALAVAGAVVVGGLYDVGASTQHTQPVYSVLETAMARTVRRQAATIEVPAPAGAQADLRGAACYRDLCVQCHGGPGVRPGPAGMSMQPLPGPLVDAARRWQLREIYWITRHGVRMSGMPAWGMRLSEEDIWSVVHFIARLPQMSPADYAARMAQVQGAQCTLPGGDAEGSSAEVPRAERARMALRQYACVSCHRIPGVTGSDTQVGPTLEGLARRTMIAGRLPNTADNLVRWIRAPQAIKPGTAMPELAVTEEHARLMAEYLSGLH